MPSVGCGMVMGGTRRGGVMTVSGRPIIPPAGRNWQDLVVSPGPW
jgi:hypothetical protein